jgi:hypothetical protein
MKSWQQIRAPEVQNYELQKGFKMEEKELNKKKRPGMKSFIGGTILTDERITRQFRLVVLLAVFGLVLIMNRNWSEKTIRQIGEMRKEVEALRSEQATISSRLIDVSRPSAVEKKVREAGIDIQEPVKPPKKLIVR